MNTTVIVEEIYSDVISNVLRFNKQARSLF